MTKNNLKVVKSTKDKELENLYTPFIPRNGET